MRLKASDKTSCLALSCGGASLGGEQRHRGRTPGSAVRARSAATTPRLCQENRDGDDGGRTRQTPAAPGMSPPEAAESRTQGWPTAGKGREGLLGCGGDPAPAPQLLFSSLPYLGPAPAAWDLLL